ncbi:hypothetical protein E34_1648 [Lactococcus lactis subsp. lactis]|nr:hypothetical protein E34_1648 [Lactococcus lactis subsp. lactis]
MQSLRNKKILTEIAVSIFLFLSVLFDIKKSAKETDIFN